MALINTSTKKEFEEEVINSKKTVLVDFWAEWCPPCKAMAPILHKLGKNLDDKVNIVKVDIEESIENHKLASEHGVQGIPNMQIYKNGKVVDEIVGLVPESTLLDKLNEISQN